MVKRIENLLRYQCHYLEVTDYSILSITNLRFLGNLMALFRNCSFFQYDQLIDIFAVDYPMYSKRTQLNYFFFHYP